ncbi:hypothetical protein [Agrobacterium sp. MS2]|uniref:hypothetical protein n=1 Tax=Agrobacterium sp. MS2 TaxID=1345498 RepID=UPI000DBF60AC|nr:hypothetical protein [Agrobacterium sp. MS2]RAL98873.1 hypothetical protein DOU54_07505 [Agrobacterium sp. MS2]
MNLDTTKTEFACCIHVRNDECQPRLIVRNSEYVKINCGRRNHSLADYDIVDPEELLRKWDIRHVLEGIEVDYQSEYCAEGWEVSAIDHETRWCDDLTDELIAELLDVARAIVQNGGVWMLRSDEGYGAITAEPSNKIPIWLSDESVSFVASLGHLNTKKYFFPIDEFIVELEIFNRTKYLDYKISIQDLLDEYSVDFYPIDLFRFLVWADTGDDPTQRPDGFDY